MWLSIIIPILLSILVIVCILLTLVVLMQRPKNEGLGAAFGSGMTENIFGAQTATVLTKATVYLGCIFFGVTLLLTVLTARQSAERRVGVLENEVRKAAVPPTAKTAVAPTPSVSPQASASVAPSASPAASVTPAPSVNAAASATPVASVSPQTSTSPSPAASPVPSPTAAANESSPAPSASVGQASPPPSASPQQ
jgi:protein translocase SecG subunit